MSKPPFVSLIGHEGMHVRDGRVVLLRRGWRRWYIGVFVFGRWRRLMLNDKCVSD